MTLWQKEIYLYNKHCSYNKSVMKTDESKTDTIKPNIYL